ncbi:MAG: hypothetical protein APF77_20485 [Clostridia bacterium BRH_c25]|nr:MAG: hypothetical protein APF77_20485 [Clostridia bacterium BRH_c25]
MIKKKNEWHLKEEDVTMIFESMNHNHIEYAVKLALAEYNEECNAVPILPEGDYYNVLYEMILELINHRLGVVALENGNLIGFLTCYEPWNNHFGTTLGTFSPIHAHGAVKENKCRIYSQLYQVAAEKWVKHGILSHAIALYAHDNDAVESFFWNGFGLRCIDAIRAVAPVTSGDYPAAEFCELAKDEIEQVVPLKNQLIKHLQNTPMFIPLFFQRDIKQVKEENERRRSRFFAIKVNGKALAFIEIMASGENFACEDAGMMNICGAYMLPQYRNSGMFTKLLSFLMDTLFVEGYTRCGVDFESFNPTASGFWLKHFTSYTYSVVRRIDERILKNS